MATLTDGRYQIYSGGPWPLSGLSKFFLALAAASSVVVLLSCVGVAPLWASLALDTGKIKPLWQQPASTPSPRRPTPLGVDLEESTEQRATQLRLAHALVLPNLLPLNPKCGLTQLGVTFWIDGLRCPGGSWRWRQTQQDPFST